MSRRTQSDGSLEDLFADELLGRSPTGFIRTSPYVGRRQQQVRPPHDPGKQARDSVLRDRVMGCLYGLIDSTVTLPDMIGYTAIIFSNPFFAEHSYLPLLLKLVLFSSVVHQLVMTMCSSLPFAVSTVQDAGLIFLASMAGSVVSKMGPEADPEAVVATVLVTLSLGTGLVGVLLIITGALRLARLVQYLPLPVIGGYLAYIGQFCGQAGLGLMTDTHIGGLGDFPRLWQDHQTVVLLLPGVACAVALYIVTSRFSGVLVMPLCLFAIPIGFFAVLFASGGDIDAAREAGWMREPTPGGVPAFWEPYELFRFDLVDWGAAVTGSTVTSFVAMFLIVALGSSLDVAAIAPEVHGERLDYDRELKSIGLSNVVSGFTGGYTGSYIFSTTLFNLRNGVKSRTCGLTLVAVELLVFFLPLDPLSILPSMFFGSVLLYIAIELIVDWLVLSWWSVNPGEFVIVWATWALINWLGLEPGMAGGVVLAALAFVLKFARTQPTEAVHLMSTLVRDARSRQRLAERRAEVITIRLHGVQFFGSVLAVTKVVEEAIIVTQPPSTTAPTLACGIEETASVRSIGVTPPHKAAEVAASAMATTPRSHQARSRLPPGSTPCRLSEVSGLLSSSPGRRHRQISGWQASYRAASRATSMASTDAQEESECADMIGFGICSRVCALLRRGFRSDDRVLKTKDCSGPWHGLDSVLLESGGHDANGRDDALNGMVPTRVVILDWSDVPACDATAAKGCFATLNATLGRHDIIAVYAAVNAPCARLLRAHGALEDDADSENRVLGGRIDEDSSGDVVAGANRRQTQPTQTPPRRFETLEMALEWAEAILLREYCPAPSPLSSEKPPPPSHPYAKQLSAQNRVGNQYESDYAKSVEADSPTSSARVTFSDVLRDFLSSPRYASSRFQGGVDGDSTGDSGADGNAPELSEELAENYFIRESFSIGEAVFSLGEESTAFYIVHEGEVTLSAGELSRSSDDSWRIERGGLFGDLDFMLRRPRTFGAVVTSHSETVVYSCSHEALGRMEREEPLLYAALLQANIQCLAMQVDALTWQGQPTRS